MAYKGPLTGQGNPVDADSTRCTACGNWMDYGCEDIYVCIACPAVHYGSDDGSSDESSKKKSASPIKDSSQKKGTTKKKGGSKKIKE